MDFAPETPARSVAIAIVLMKTGSEAVSKHLERDLESLEEQLLSMSASVEAMIDKAWRSLSDRQGSLSSEVIAADESIDQQEVRIEEECLKILALHQPVAIDLRRTATILKVNNDLERIADLAVNVAERGQQLRSAGEFTAPPLLKQLAQESRRMVNDALNALVRLDPDAALKVCAADDAVDRTHAEIVEDLYRAMCKTPDHIGAAMHYLSVARQLERIADHATNIAEDVIYLVRGDIARHRGKQLQKQMAGTE